VGEQIAEAVRLHRNVPAKEAMDAAVAMLDAVGIPEPARRARSYPHELSGGMRQRIVIAMALVLEPRIILADEPTTALDVTIQAEILELMDRLKTERGTSVLLITHDLGVVAQTCRRVAVMYAGKVVEEAEAIDFFAGPQHPYARLLLASVPRISQDGGSTLAAIPGTVPSIFNLPQGCHFHPRCPEAFDRCRQERPSLYDRGNRRVRCFLYA
jgi:oligopeptide/dipeptide ABC transporter ATP-binding protein